jgi:hypothetical protein
VRLPGDPQAQAGQAPHAELAGENDKVPGNLFAALGNVVPTHLYDQQLRLAVGLDPLSGERVDDGEDGLPEGVLGGVAPLSDRP